MRRCSPTWSATTGKRVYLVALAIRLGGARAEAALNRYIEPVGWIATALLVALAGWLAWHAWGT